jgi:2-aminoethylphosphonate-pyruvate transaminase
LFIRYHYPTDSNWDFPRFYRELNERGFVIYPGKVSNADCFRIGHIGRIFPDDTQRLVDAIKQVCKQMKTAKYAHAN